MKRDISKYVRVSQILSIFQNYSQVPLEKLKRAQDTGTAIHEAIEKYFSEEFIPLDHQRTPYFESFLKWATVCHPIPLFLEKRLFDEELMVTGQFDLMAEMGDYIYLVDFKTGSWAHKEIWELQMHWYWMLLVSEGHPILPAKFLIVQLQKDGSEPVLYEYFHNERALSACFSSYECWKFFNKHLALN